YNALGIAYLELARYPEAISALLDAIDRAPLWAYPRHNLALALSESGDYRAAVRTYQEAARLAPDYSYLPYNLGLLYQRTNRKAQAEEQYKKAIALGPQRAEPYTALGALKASAGKSREARALYEQAVSRAAEGTQSLKAARHNLATLIADDEPDEALRLWRLNGDYLASQLGAAEWFAARGDSAQSIEWYRNVLSQAPDHVSARIGLARQLELQGRVDDAIAELG